MTQHDLNAAVANATGESVALIRDRGFGLADPLDVVLNKIGSDNANSITLAVEHGGRRLLLPRLGIARHRRRDGRIAYDCDVLLAPHHGSRRSDPPGFAAWSSPEWVVISGGGGDDEMPVVETYRRAGAAVLRTNECGTVHFSIRRGTLEMASWLGAMNHER